MMPKLPEPDLCDGVALGKNEKYFGTFDGYTPETVLAIQEEAYRAGMAAAVPDGWKVVPVEPSPKMLKAAQKADMYHGPHDEWLEYDGADVVRIFKAMLSATPEVK
jgi:hypothetical protein